MAKKKTAKQEAPVTDDVAEEYDATRYTPWAPGNMPVGGKSNSTEQLNDHPTEHNHSAEAISDIVDRFADLRLYVPAANSCGVDGDLRVNGQITATDGGSKDAPAFQIGPDKALGMFGSINSQWIRFTTDGEYRFQISSEKSTAYGDLQVNGQIKAQNGTAAAPAYSFNSDTKSGFTITGAGPYPSKAIVSVIANGKQAANFGDEGASLPPVYDLTSALQPNLGIRADGSLYRSTAARADSADLERLETIIETLSARIEQLEARLETGTADA
jgi:hypothetical protein